MKLRSFSWIWMLVGLVGLPELHAQYAPELRPLQISFYDNATLFPGSDQWAVWGFPVHPGVTLGTEFYYRQQSNSDVFQSVRAGYHFQRFIQHSVLLYSELGYRQKWNRISLEGRLGGGYLHAISASPVYRQTNNGSFERTGRLGRPQAMVSLALGPAFRIAGTETDPVWLFVQYQAYLQLPFVGQYIPILPNTALHLGVSIPLLKTNRS